MLPSIVVRRANKIRLWTAIFSVSAHMQAPLIIPRERAAPTEEYMSSVCISGIDNQMIMIIITDEDHLP